MSHFPQSAFARLVAPRHMMFNDWDADFWKDVAFTESVEIKPEPIYRFRQRHSSNPQIFYMITESNELIIYDERLKKPILELLRMLTPLGAT